MKSMAGISSILLCICSLAFATEDCDESLKSAETHYQNAEYDSALTQVNACLRKPNLSQPDKVEAFKLLGKISVMRGEREAGKQAFIQLLKLRPLMQLQSDTESPEVETVFNQARDEFFSGAEHPPGKKSKNWPWLVVSGAVMVTVIALML